VSRFLFVNQFIPPDPAPTSRLLGEVAEALAKRGHEVVFIGHRSRYRGKKTLLGSRALREGLALLRLWWKTATAPRCDAIVFLTSPPLLPIAIWAASFRHRGAKRIHWAMDLYPDVAVALGEVREGSLLHRVTARAMESVYHACDLIIVLDPEMAARVSHGGVRLEIVPPWPPPVARIEIPPPREGGPFLWLYSGNLGRAHEWRTLLEAQRLLEDEGLEIDLVFQGGGAEREAAQDHATELGLKRCHWRDYAPETELVSSLLGADALVVTQRPETAGCLWPSKLALARIVERPLLWVGATGGSIALTLDGEGETVLAPGESARLAERLRILAAPGRVSTVGQDSATRLRQRLEQQRSQGVEKLIGALEHSLGAPAGS
jgi:glycosyltransferase involved in cell wall biosynthesis